MPPLAAAAPFSQSPLKKAPSPKSEPTFQPLIFFCPDWRYCSIFASPSFMPKPTAASAATMRFSLRVIFIVVSFLSIFCGTVRCPESLLLYHLDVRQYPGLFEQRLLRSVEAEDQEVIFAGRNPVRFQALRSLRPEVEVHGAGLT